MAGGGVWVPGGPPGLQNRCGRGSRSGGFDSRPPPPPALLRFGSWLGATLAASEMSASCHSPAIAGAIMGRRVLAGVRSRLCSIPRLLSPTTRRLRRLDVTHAAVLNVRRHGGAAVARYASHRRSVRWLQNNSHPGAAMAPCFVSRANHTPRTRTSDSTRPADAPTHHGYS